MSGLDHALALSLQDKYDKEGVVVVEDTKTSPKVKGIVDEHWELADPNPNIHQLFVQYDTMFFWGKLTANGVAVDWSNRMTLCAGLCSYEGRAGFCSIRLSLPLLKLRPRKDLVETLLHEMIHAYLFVTHNNKDHDGHGPQFLSHMHRINNASGTKITVFHSFHNEVKQYKNHWWKCNGPCQHRHPYYGMVKRAMNRPPSPHDLWWAEHQKTCGGNYTKIKEPEGYGKKKSKKKDTVKVGESGNQDIRELLGGRNKGETSKPAPGKMSSGAFVGRGFVLGEEFKDKEKTDLRTKILIAAEKRKESNERLGRIRGTADSGQGFVRPRGYKKPRLDNDKECIIIDNSSASDDDGLYPPDDDDGDGSEVEASSIVISDNEPSTEDSQYSVEDVVCMDDSHVTGPTSSPPENSRKLKTCPVCGIDNIPTTIINFHVSLCLEADETACVIDDDNI